MILQGRHHGDLQVRVHEVGLHMHRVQVHVIFLDPKVPHQPAVHVSRACFTLGSQDANCHDDESTEAAGADTRQDHEQGDQGLATEAKAALAVGSSPGDQDWRSSGQAA